MDIDAAVSYHGFNTVLGRMLWVLWNDVFLGLWNALVFDVQEMSCGYSSTMLWVLYCYMGFYESGFFIILVFFTQAILF